MSGLLTASAGTSVSGASTFGVGSGGAGTGLTVNNALFARFLNTSGNTFAETTAITPLLFTQSNFSGSLSGSGQAGINRMAVTSDTMDCTNGADAICKGLELEWNITGAAKGGRTGVWAQFSPSSLSNVQEIVALRGAVSTASAMGGSFLQMLTTQVDVRAGTSSVGNTLDELGYSSEAAGAIGVKGALQITLNRGDTAAGTTADAGMFFANSNNYNVSPGMGSAIALGNTSQGWPVNPTTGKVLSVLLQTVDQGNGADARFIQPTALAGIDFGPVNFTTNSGFSFVGPAFAITGAGGIWSANLLVSTNSSGVQLDIPDQIVTAASVSVAGTATNNGSNSYHPGDYLSGLASPSNGQYQVASTKVLNAAVAVGGSGGTNGACTVTDASGATGTPFQLAGTVSGGALSGALTVSVAGSYTSENPSGVISTAQIPVTGCGLTGAKVTAGMGVNSFSILVPDVSASAPATIAMAGGSGSGAVLTPTWTTRNTLMLNPSGRGVQIGSASLTLAAGEVGLTKIAASGSAPGASGLKLGAVCGTNAGTAKIIAYAGTSTTPVTVVDNVGSGVTGC